MGKEAQVEVPQMSSKVPALFTFLGRKAIPHSPPFAVWLAEWPVAWGAHLQWGGSAIASAFLTAASIGLTYHTWWVGRNAKRQRQILATLTAGAATGWFTAATVAGPATSELVNAWLMGGPTLAGAWSITMAMRANPDKAEASGDGSEKGLLAKIGLAGAKAKEIKAGPNKVTVPIELERGKQSQDDAAKAAKNLAGLAGVPETAVRWEKDPEDAGQGQYVIIPEDMLKEPTPWPGPSAPGQSIADAPIPAGVYEDEGTADLWLNGDEAVGRNAAHYQFMGMTGSGKSQGGRVILTDLMTRNDVVTWLFDPSKGQQTFGPVLHGADWAMLTMKDCKAGISVLPDVITARADELGRHGYDQWTPEAGRKLGMPYMVCWFEEVAKLFREGVDLAPIAQEARSAGITLVFSLQRSSHTSMDTDVRANIAGAQVFGTNSAMDSSFALSDETVDAGARPEAWRNRKAGYCYIEGPGLDEERWATPIRTFLLDKELAAQVIAAYESVRPSDAGVVTATAAGTAYANRTRYSAGEEVVIDRQQDDADADLDAEDLALHATEPEYADLHVDIDQALRPVPDGMDLPLGTPQQETKSREEALQALDEVLQDFAGSGRLEFGPRHITPELPRIGKSSSWVRKELIRLRKEGVLDDTDEPGVYRIRTLQPV
jgi:hypothetical protein